MNKKKLLVTYLIIGTLQGYAQDGIIGNITYQDTILAKIDSITTFILHPDSKFAYAEETDPNSPNGLYAIYRADTIKGELRKVIYYTYDKKIIKLLNYYYWNNNLIKVSEYRARRRRNRDDKFDKFERTSYYWNEKLYYSYNPTEEPYDYKLDLQNGQLLIKRFQGKYSLNQLDFNRAKK